MYLDIASFFFYFHIHKKYENIYTYKKNSKLPTSPEMETYYSFLLVGLFFFFFKVLLAQYLNVSVSSNSSSRLEL